GRRCVELGDQAGLAYSTGLLTTSRTGAAFFIAYLGTAPASATASEAGILRELERVRESPISADELARAKAYVRGQLGMDRPTNARGAWYLAFFETIAARLDYPDPYGPALAPLSLQ